MDPMMGSKMNRTMTEKAMIHTREGSQTNLSNGPEIIHEKDIKDTEKSNNENVENEENEENEGNVENDENDENVENVENDENDDKITILQTQADYR